MAYTSEQRANLALAQRVGRQVGATATEVKAAIEAMLVESGARNLTYGDRDSLGILQQRPSQGWKNATNPAGALADFYSHAKALRGKGLSSGALAQAVQRSAYPGRYAQRAGEAQAILKGKFSGGGGTSLTPASGSQTYAQPVDQTDQRRTLILNYLQGSHKPGAILDLALGIHGLQQQQSQQPVVPTVTGQSGQPNTASGSTSGSGSVVFDGKPTNADFAKQLAWARSHGWKGTVTSGTRTKSQQMAAAQSYGLQHYGPAGPLGSLHVKGEAVDVTNPEQLNQVLRKYPGRRTLVWGGPIINDPVHFSTTGH